MAAWAPHRETVGRLLPAEREAVLKSSRAVLPASPAGLLGPARVWATPAGCAATRPGRKAGPPGPQVAAANWASGCGRKLCLNEPHNVLLLDFCIWARSLQGRGAPAAHGLLIIPARKEQASRADPTMHAAAAAHTAASERGRGRSAMRHVAFARPQQARVRASACAVCTHAACKPAGHLLCKAVQDDLPIGALLLVLLDVPAGSRGSHGRDRGSLETPCKTGPPPHYYPYPTPQP